MVLLDNVTERDVRTAGVWFVGQYAGILMENIDEMNKSTSFKANFIQRIFLQTGRDKGVGGTRWRVAAVLRIIERGTIKDALQYVVQSDRVNKEDPQAVLAANQTLAILG